MWQASTLYCCLFWKLSQAHESEVLRSRVTMGMQVHCMAGPELVVWQAEAADGGIAHPDDSFW